MSVLTTTEVKTLLDISGSASDARIDALLPLMQGLVESASGIYERAEVVEVYSGTGSTKLVLRSGLNPIAISEADPTAPFTLRISAAHDFSNPDVELTDDDCFVDVDAGLVERYSGALPVGVGNLQATYTRGYTAAEYPGPLKGLLARAIGVGLETFTPQQFESIKIGAFSLDRDGGQSGSEGGFTSMVPEWDAITGLFVDDGSLD